MKADSIGKFIDEYRNVIKAIIPSVPNANFHDYLYGSSPDYDRTREYWFAARYGNFGLGRVGLEITHPNSFFSLYAAAYHRRFIVSYLTSAHTYSDCKEWLQKMQAAKEVIDVVNFDELDADFCGGDRISNIFCFRLIDNVEDDELFIARLGEIIPPYGFMTFSFNFSHSVAFEYDSTAGFRVYNDERVDWLFRHFDVVYREAHEAAEAVALNPRPFDMTTYTLTVQKK